MLRTLYSRLAAVLLGLFALVGVTSIVGTLHFFQLYSEESNQRLNQPLARHLADQNQLSSMTDANPARLRTMFDMQMIINPSIQIYLLDSSGRIQAYSAASGAVNGERVALEPVKAFLEHTGAKDLGATSPDDRWTVIEVECLGACGFATPVLINDDFIENVTPEKVPGILERYR